MPSALDDLESACAALALREASGADDLVVLEALREEGWTEGDGAWTEQWYAAARTLGLRLTRAGYAGLTLRQLCRREPLGLWLVETHNHLLVVRDGEVVDPRSGGGPRRRVWAAWRVTTPAEQPPRPTAS